MTAVGRPGLSAAAPWVAVGLAALLALMLGWTSLQRNVQAACDGLEWPNLSSCPSGRWPGARAGARHAGAHCREPG